MLYGIINWFTGCQSLADKLWISQAAYFVSGRGGFQSAISLKTPSLRFSTQHSVCVRRRWPGFRLSAFREHLVNPVTTTRYLRARQHRGDDVKLCKTIGGVVCCQRGEFYLRERSDATRSRLHTAWWNQKHLRLVSLESCFHQGKCEIRRFEYYPTALATM